MSFFQELLNVLGSRATGSGFKETTSSKERNNTEHLGTCSELNNREKISKVISKDVARDSNSVLSSSASGHAQVNGINRVHNADVKTSEVVVDKVLLN